MNQKQAATPATSPARLLTLARDLKRRKARERHALFVAEGVRSVEEVVRSSVVLRGALVTDVLLSGPRAEALITLLAARGAECVTVTEAEFLSAAGTDNPQGVLAIAEVPERSLESLAPADLARVLVLDAIQDPGNVGALIRTAAALGARTVVALPGTADPWNSKVVRAAGGHFHLAVTHADLSELINMLAAANVPLWGADAGGRPVTELRAPGTFALAMGNEGAGLSAGVRLAAAELVALPMSPGVESLNVAVAAGVLLYALGR